MVVGRGVAVLVGKPGKAKNHQATEEEVWIQKGPNREVGGHNRSKHCHIVIWPRFLLALKTLVIRNLPTL